MPIAGQASRPTTSCVSFWRRSPRTGKESPAPPPFANAPTGRRGPTGCVSPASACSRLIDRRATTNARAPASGPPIRHTLETRAFREAGTEMSVAGTLVRRAQSEYRFRAFRDAFERAGVQSWLKPDEMALHFGVGAFSEGSRHLVEIGAFEGASAAFAAAGLKHGGRGLLYSVDPHLGGHAALAIHAAQVRSQRAQARGGRFRQKPRLRFALGRGRVAGAPNRLGPDRRRPLVPRRIAGFRELGSEASPRRPDHDRRRRRCGVAGSAGVRELSEDPRIHHLR